MTQAEDFDKDIELAKLQFAAGFFAAWYSVCLSAGLALVGGALLTFAAYLLVTQGSTTTTNTLVASIFLTIAEFMGIALVVAAIVKYGRNRKKWKKEFNRISKLAKAEKQSKIHPEGLNRSVPTRVSGPNEGKRPLQ